MVFMSTFMYIGQYFCISCCIRISSSYLEEKVCLRLVQRGKGCAGHAALAYQRGAKYRYL